MPRRRLVLYIATSLDGFIAREDDDIGWLSVVGSPDEDYGYSDFIKTVDTVIMGRRTYDKVLHLTDDFPHKDRKCYVLSRNREGAEDYITFYKGPIEELVEAIRTEEGKDIFCDGGADVVNQLLAAELIDRFIISVVPIILGGGIRLFGGEDPGCDLKLVRNTTFSSGLVQLWYDKVTPG